MPQLHDELKVDAEKVIAQTRELLSQNRLQSALATIWTLVTRANQYVDHTAPFKLAKDPAQAGRLDEVLYDLGTLYIRPSSPAQTRSWFSVIPTGKPVSALTH